MSHEARSGQPSLLSFDDSFGPDQARAVPAAPPVRVPPSGDIFAENRSGGAASGRQRRAPSADFVSGHRERLRARFDRGETLSDYELMELLLFLPLPRRDTKPLAKRLIAEFGSFGAALTAPVERLTQLEGVGSRVVSDFRLVRAAAERLALAALRKGDLMGSTDAVAQFYRTKLIGLKREEFHILFLDKKNRFLASECAGIGTVDHAPVYPREVVTRALALSASAIVLVHNHPSGDPTPSRADVAVTQTIVQALAPVGIAVHDHVIIAGADHLSLRGEGYL